MWAAQCNTIDPLVVLLRHEADVEATSQLGFTPLCIAAVHGHANVVHILLCHKANPSTKGQDSSSDAVFSPLEWANYYYVSESEVSIQYDRIEMTYKELVEDSGKPPCTRVPWLTMHCRVIFIWDAISCRAAVA